MTRLGSRYKYVKSSMVHNNIAFLEIMEYEKVNARISASHDNCMQYFRESKEKGSYIKGLHRRARKLLLQ